LCTEFGCLMDAYTVTKKVVVSLCVFVCIQEIYSPSLRTI
jgi:hypothetical protein